MTWQSWLRSLEGSLGRAARARNERDRIRELHYALQDFERLKNELQVPSGPQQEFPTLFVSRSALDVVVDSLAAAVTTSEHYLSDDPTTRVVPDAVVMAVVDRLRAL